MAYEIKKEGHVPKLPNGDLDIEKIAKWTEAEVKVGTLVAFELTDTIANTGMASDTQWAWSIGKVSAVNTHERLVTLGQWDPPRRDDFSMSDEQITARLGRDIDAREEEIEKLQRDITEGRDVLKRQAAGLNEHRQMTEGKLNAVQPLLDEARAALGKINEDFLRELRSYQTPPDTVRRVMECVLILINRPGSTAWEPMRAFIRKDDMIKTILDFDARKLTKHAVATVEKYLQDPSFTQERCNRASFAAGVMYTWIEALVRFSDVLFEVQPLMADLEATRDKMRKIEMANQDLLADLCEQEVKLEAKHKEYDMMVYGNEPAKTAAGTAAMRSKPGWWRERNGRKIKEHVILRSSILRVCGNGEPQFGRYLLTEEEAPTELSTKTIHQALIDEVRRLQASQTSGSQDAKKKLAALAAELEAERQRVKDCHKKCEEEKNGLRKRLADLEDENRELNEGQVELIREQSRNVGAERPQATEEGEAVFVNGEEYFPGRPAMPVTLAGNVKLNVALSVSVFAIFFLVAIPLGTYGAVQFFESLSFSEYSAEVGTVLYNTNEYRQVYPQYFDLDTIFIRVSSEPGGQALNSEARFSEMQYMAETLQQTLVGSRLSDDNVDSIRSYFLPCFENTSLISGTNNDTTVISLRYTRSSAKPILPLIDLTMSEIGQHVTNGFSYEVSGVPLLNDSRDDSVLSNLVLVNGIAMLLALVAFVFASKSIPLVVIPIAVMLCGLATTFGFGHILKSLTSVNGLAPQVVIAVVLILSFNYSLFTILRLRDLHTDAAVRDRFSSVDIVWLAYKRSAHAMLLSGLSLFTIFVCVAFVQSVFLRPFALLAAAASLFTMIAGLTVIPAALRFLYPFCFQSPLKSNYDASFSASADIKKDGDGQPLTMSAETSYTSDYGGTHRVGISGVPEGAAGAYTATRSLRDRVADMMRVLLKPKPLSEEQRDQLTIQGSLWGRVAAVCVEYPHLALLPAAALIAVPLFLVSTHYDFDDSLLTTAPYTRTPFKAYVSVLDTYQDTLDAPLTMYISTLASANDTCEHAVLRTPIAWIVVQCVVDALREESKAQLPYTSIVSPDTLPNGTRITRSEAHELYKIAMGTKHASSMDEAALASVFINTLEYTLGSKGLAADETCNAAVKVRMPTPTYGGNGAQYLEDFHGLVSQCSNLKADGHSHYFLGYGGPSANEWQTMNRVMQSFKTEIIVLVVVTFLGTLSLFHSFFFALLTLITVSYSVVCGQAAAVLVFRFSWLHGAWPALAQVESFYWIVCLMGMLQGVTFAIEYNAQLLTRVFELRRHRRLTNNRSVVLALAQSMETTVASAVMLMFIFGSLVVANNVMIAQLGIMGVFTVAVDAFFVRPVLVPALIAITPRFLVWAPRPMVRTKVEEEAVPSRPNSMASTSMEIANPIAARDTEGGPSNI